MFGPFRRLLVRLFKVPPEPAPPSGSASSIRVFRASRRYYQYALFEWGLKQLGAFAGIIVFLQMQEPALRWVLPDELVELLAPYAARLGASDPQAAVQAGVRKLLSFVELAGLAALIAQLPFTYALVRLDYEFRWYIVTDRSLRIREGIQRVREMTMTFANIQNVTIEKGPVQRLLGIADVKVRSAGGGGSEGASEAAEKGASMHVGYFRGVDNAGEIRSLIFERLRQLKSAGLGDPEDDERALPATPADRDAGPADGEAAHAGSSAGPLAAARTLLDEARALRRALS